MSNNIKAIIPLRALTPETWATTRDAGLSKDGRLLDMVYIDWKFRDLFGTPSTSFRHDQERFSRFFDMLDKQYNCYSTVTHVRIESDAINTIPENIARFKHMHTLQVEGSRFWYLSMRDVPNFVQHLAFIHHSNLQAECLDGMAQLTQLRTLTLDIGILPGMRRCVGLDPVEIYEDDEYNVKLHEKENCVATPKTLWQRFGTAVVNIITSLMLKRVTPLENVPTLRKVILSCDVDISPSDLHLHWRQRMRNHPSMALLRHRIDTIILNYEPTYASQGYVQHIPLDYVQKQYDGFVKGVTITLKK